MKQAFINEVVANSTEIYFKGLFTGIVISGIAVLYFALIG